ncbi:MAG: hypothetical protein V4635_10115 [Bacteroidota bacterium]
MKKSLVVYSLLSLFFCNSLRADKTVPDTVYTGVYITSIHDIDFKGKEYTVNLWLWLKYKNRDFNFVQNLEVPQAKTVAKSFSTIDSTGERIYLLMKLQCVMKDTWKIENFPFDHQKLRFAIENSQFDSNSLVFAADRAGENHDPRFTLRGWHIDSLNVSTGIKGYETAFGDDDLPQAHTDYSTYKVKIVLSREALGLFGKMFLGMYMAFLIAYVCFFIHLKSIEARFGLGVGALFAVIGNKYVIDSALPDTSAFTLVDTLHGITLFFIFLVIVSAIYTLYLTNKNEEARANRFDKIVAVLTAGLYIILNIYFINEATGG